MTSPLTILRLVQTVAIRSKRRSNTWTQKARRSLILFTSVLVHCTGQRVRNKCGNLRRKGASSMFRSLRFKTHVAGNGVRIKVPVHGPDVHTYPIHELRERKMLAVMIKLTTQQERRDEN